VDVIATQRHFLNLGTPLSGCRLTAADVNGINGVDTIDVIAIQRFFLGFSTGIAILESANSVQPAGIIQGLLVTRPLRITTPWSLAMLLLRLRFDFRPFLFDCVWTPPWRLVARNRCTK